MIKMKTNKQTKKLAGEFKLADENFKEQQQQKPIYYK